MVPAGTSAPATGVEAAGVDASGAAVPIDAVNAEIPAVAVPVPTNPGGLSLVGTVWNAPPSTETCQTIGWSLAAKFEKVPETSVQLAEAEFWLWAKAAPANARVNAYATSTTSATFAVGRLTTDTVPFVWASRAATWVSVDGLMARCDARERGASTGQTA